MRIAAIRIFALLAYALPACGMSTARRAELRDEVRSMFHHGYTSYMTHAYPADELRPLTCGPLWRDTDHKNIGVNDIHANVSMTLVDGLSALLLILPDEWPAAVEKVAENTSFDQDVKVQVFEMTIRALGALLSTYQRLERLPVSPKAQAADLGLKNRSGVDVKKHAPRILELATDLARRLLPAFNSQTGMPYARVNLRKGVEKGESVETCAGSLVLEFTLLSRITGDPKYEELAKAAFMAVWNRRNDQDLIGNQIEIVTGRWLPPGVSGVHAGIDSFFEYALKAAIVMDDSSYMDIFNDAFAAIQSYIRTEDGFIYRPVYMRGFNPTTPSYVDSLSAFFPGVMVLAGDLESAIRGHLIFWNIWRRYDAIPESWDMDSRAVGWGGWPGRPEFIESTYYLHRATGDDFYLRVGERVMKDILRRTLTTCGFARLSNVETGALDDRMESFMLSETLKYLYLLFDTADSDESISNTVFTTEGHPISLPANLVPLSEAWHESHRNEDLYCPVYTPPTIGGVRVGIEGRDDYDYARSLVFGETEKSLNAEQDLHAWGDGVCAAKPIVPRFAIDLVLLPVDAPLDAPYPEHDPSPSTSKVFQNASGDWVIADTDGVRVNVHWRIDGNGYEVVSIGPHRVRRGQSVTITDKRMNGYLPAQPPPAPYSVAKVHLSVTAPGKSDVLTATDASTALFGRSFTPAPAHLMHSDARWHLDTPLLLATTLTDPEACNPISRLAPPPRGRPFVLLADRGKCTFVEKAQRAIEAGAAGLIIVDTEGPVDGIIRPSASGETDAMLHKLSKLAVAFIPHSSGAHIRDLMAEHDVVVSARDEGEGTVHGGQREGRLVVGDHEIVNMRVVEV